MIVPSNCCARFALAGAAIPAAFAGIRVPLAMVDLQWRVQAANAPFARLLAGLAWQSEELAGRGLRELVEPADMGR